MPYTVAVSFDKFISNISISGNQQSTSTSRRESVVSLLKKDFDILESFATGSIPKRTAVRGSDLDVMVVLHYGKHIKDRLPSQVLQTVQKTLSGYTTSVRRNGQAVTLKFKTWPDVDIVPVSRTVNDDGTVNHYDVPNMNNETWIDSRPKLHAANIADRASSYGPEFRRTIRIIKWWNKQHRGYLQSYHIEVLAFKILTGSFSGYPWAVYNFFDEASKLVESSLWHDTGYVDNYLSYSDRQEALKRLRTARSKASDAWYKTYGSNDDHKGAIEIWKQIFGDQFPAYG